MFLPANQSDFLYLWQSLCRVRAVNLWSEGCRFRVSLECPQAIRWSPHWSWWLQVGVQQRHRHQCVNGTGTVEHYKRLRRWPLRSFVSLTAYCFRSKTTWWSWSFSFFFCDVESLSSVMMGGFCFLCCSMTQTVQTNGVQPLSKTWELSLYELQRTPQVRHLASL